MYKESGDIATNMIEMKRMPGFQSGLAKQNSCWYRRLLKEIQQ